MTQTLILGDSGKEIRVMDDQVHFTDGPTVNRRTIQADDGSLIVIVEPPFGEIESGCRVLSGDVNSGIGRALDPISGNQMGLFYSQYGVEFVTKLGAGSKRLPETIWVSIVDQYGVDHFFDETAAILNLSLEEVLSLGDDVVPAFMADRVSFPALGVDIATAVSFYFGKMPDPGENGLVVSQSIKNTDLVQCQHLFVDIEQEMTMSLDQAVI